MSSLRFVYICNETRISSVRKVLIATVLKWPQAKEKYRGVFEIQKSGDKTSSRETGLDTRTHASPKVGQDQVSGGVSVPCRHATPVADALWKPIVSNNYICV